MRVLKFGGSSVGTPERIKGVCKIIGSQPLPCVVVVSAFQGITDRLSNLVHLAASGSGVTSNEFDTLITTFREFSTSLLRDQERQELVREKINRTERDIRESLEKISASRIITRSLSDKVLSAGEMISSFLIHNMIPNSLYADASDLITAEIKRGQVVVDFDSTSKKIGGIIGHKKQLTIVPGYYGCDPAGELITLGRGGSDYSAAIIAAALGAEMLEIWTDVDGFMTADPKKVEKAYTIESLTYPEAMELSHFGAKVIYTPTLRPVYRKNIPVMVRNTFNPGSKGTVIGNKSSGESRSPIKGISSIDHIDLMTLQGPAMVGITGTSARLFSALARKDINIILITQASSEFSITFAVNPGDSATARIAIDEEFERETGVNKELKIVVERNLSIIAIVGEKMKNTPGISATLFRALGRNGINVVATAQGSSELNISVVIRNESLKKALNVIHDGFFLSSFKEINLFIAGTGLVGSSLLKQLRNQEDILFREHKLKLNLMGISNSRRMLTDKKGISLASCRELLARDGTRADISEFIDLMKKMNLRNSAFIDCTADPKVAERYLDVLSGYISVVAANKIACSSELGYYHELKSTANERGVRLMYETTVGAGLPIIKTISDLVMSGDKIHRIEAILSGTLNFIFNELSSTLSMSRAIRMAKEKGLTEPDPRTDLSGTDVVRKILILSREAGYNIERENVDVIKFLPDSCFEGDLNDFYSSVEKLDPEFEEKRKDLAANNKKWRFFALLDQGKARVELLAVGPEHPSYYLEGSNNIVLITSERYRELPMVIKGYGAGADVTAAGVFADIMRVVNV